MRKSMGPQMDALDELPKESLMDFYKNSAALNHDALKVSLTLLVTKTWTNTKACELIGTGDYMDAADLQEAYKDCRCPLSVTYIYTIIRITI